MHASTCIRTPRSSAAAAIGAIGSRTPCAYDGALATTSTVESSIAAAIAAGSARNVSGSTGTSILRSPNRCAALWNAACAVVGSTIDGEVISGWASRAASTASRHDSVPPDVTEPTTPGTSPSNAEASATRSFSMRSKLGNAVGSRPLAEDASACAAAPRESTSDSPLSYT